MEGDRIINGLTEYLGKGNSQVYLSKSAFTSISNLKITIGHEYIHATHNMMLSKGKITNKIRFHEMTEISAYNWETHMMRVKNGYSSWTGHLGEFSWDRVPYFNWLMKAKF